MHILIAALHRPSKPTGVCRHAANLAQCLAETNEVTQVSLIIGEWQRQYFETSFNLSSPKIKLISVAIKNSSLSRNSWFLFGLPKLADRLQADLIHMSFPFPFIRQWFKAPIVSTIHDLYPYECPENFGYPQVWFNRWFLNQCIRNSDGLSCVSKTTLESLSHYFKDIHSRKQTTVIYNYVDLNQITPKQPERIPCETQSPFLLFVGQHRKNKNIDLLIQAYALMRYQGNLKPEIKLFIVGTAGPETESIQNLIQSLDLHNQVTLLSSINDEELCWLYKHCELFVIPSSTEGFCLPLVEALSLSCKVVCSDIPIFREVGSLSCHYFDLKNEPIANLAKAMTTALAQPPNHALMDLRFSKQAVAQQLLQFYDSIR